MTEPTGKTCTRCGVFQPLTDFAPSRHGVLGRASHCKACKRRQYALDAAKRRTPAPTVAVLMVCGTCGVEKPSSEFYWRPDAACYRKNCKTCHLIQNKVAWHAKPQDRLSRADRQWRHGLRDRFGLTPEEYHALVGKQGGGCAICGATTDPDGRRLAVDHDHQTGAVRGVLCGRCNKGLGQFQDDPERLARAINYLEGEVTAWPDRAG